MSEAESAILAIKLFYASLSAAGFITGLLILYFGKPGLTVRMAIVASSALALVTAILMGGDLFAASTVPDRFTALRQAGWFALGLLFGAGRGDKIVKYFPALKGERAPGVEVNYSVKPEASSAVKPDGNSAELTEKPEE